MNYQRFPHEAAPLYRMGKGRVIDRRKIGLTCVERSVDRYLVPFSPVVVRFLKVGHVVHTECNILATSDKQRYIEIGPASRDRHQILVRIVC
jgi:hypothetical protein